VRPSRQDGSIDETGPIGRSRGTWLPPVVIGLTLVLLGSMIALGRWQLHATLSRQIVQHDAEVLDAVATLEQLGADSPAALAHQLEETAGQLTLALRLSRLREGVLATRLFDAQGQFVAALPALVRETRLTADELEVMTRLQPLSRYEPAARLTDHFLVAPEAPTDAQPPSPLLSVLIPLQAPGQTNLLAVAELIQDGSAISRDLAELDRHLSRQAIVAFTLSGSLAILMLGGAFWRLQQITTRLQQHAAELQRANHELALSAKTSALGAVTAHLLHGLASPLTGLQNFMVARAADDADWQDALRGTERMQGLVGEVIRVLSEQTEGATYMLPLTELAQVLADRSQAAAAQAGVQFQLRITVDAALANRNANLVLLILENLVRNAIEATPRGKMVQLTIAPADDGAVCEVADQGPGLPETVRQNLFLPSRSTKPGGNGIGLALSLQLARHLPADLRLVRSTPAGSAFALVLPRTLLVDERPAGAALLAPQPAPSTGARPDAGAARGSWSRSAARSARCAWPFLLCLAASLASLGADISPSAWRWSNPAPHGAKIVDTAYAGGLAVHVGDHGQIFTSTDLDHWIPRDSHTDRFLRGVTFLGGRLVICGEQGTILFADDPAEFYLVDLATQDWLESAAASPSLVVIVGDRGALYTSTNAVSWTRRNAGSQTWLRSVAWGASGFVAVGESGYVTTSATGETWRARNSGTSLHLNRVAWINGHYWIAGDSGKVLTSENGNAWSAVTTGATNHLAAVAGAGDSDLIAGNAEVRWRAGSAWNDELAATKTCPPPVWSYYSALWDGASYWLGGDTGLWVQGYRTNSLSDLLWYEPAVSIHHWLWAVTRTPHFYLAVGDRGTVMASGDGVDWDLDLVPDSVTNTVFLGVGGRTNHWIAVGQSGTIISSTNGVTWQAVEPRPTSADLQGLTATDNLFLASGAQGTILTSPDAIHWARQTTPTTQFLSSLAAFPGGLVAVGDHGTILTSPDGTNWTLRSVATTNWFWQVRHLGGTLLLVGENGTVRSSQNGVDWTACSSGTGEWLTDATFIPPTWFVVGTGGTVLASTNLTDWASLGTLTDKSLFGAAAAEGQLLTVGVEGIILRRQIVPDLTPIQFVSYDRTAEHNVFLFGGKPDQSFWLERSPDLALWAPSLEIEFTDGTGTILLVEPVVPGVPREFYRGQLPPASP